MASPIITAEQIRERYTYSPDTGEFKAKPLKHARLYATSFGRISPSGYLVCTIGGRTYKMHRLAWLYVHGRFPEKGIDHINGIKTDNRICNLRECTQSENLQNRTDVKGAYRRKGSSRWTAQIGIQKKYITLGTFDTYELARQAYVEAKRKLHPFGQL